MTAETAVLLPALVLVVATLLVLVQAASLQTVAQDAAALGARTAARGEDDAQVQVAARQVVPPGADVLVRRAGGLVTVEVRLPVAVRGVLGQLLGQMSVTARSVAADEAVS